ncbi:MAG: hypothetical protein GY856_29865, partial [bacterium]|nr:hypothetical protein [bacterium]
MKADATVDSRFPTLLVNLLVFAVATTVALLVAEGLVRLFNLLPHQRAAAAVRTAAEDENENENENGGDDEPASMWILHPYRGITPRPL